MSETEMSPKAEFIRIPNFTECRIFRSSIFALSCRRRSVSQIFRSIEREGGYFKNFLVYRMMTNIMVKACPKP